MQAPNLRIRSEPVGIVNIEGGYSGRTKKNLSSGSLVTRLTFLFESLRGCPSRLIVRVDFAEQRLAEGVDRPNSGSGRYPIAPTLRWIAARILPDANLVEVLRMLLEDGEPDLSTEFIGTQTIAV